MKTVASLRSIPHIAGPPFIGSLNDFRHRRLALFSRIYHECGDIGSFRVGPWLIVAPTSPAYAHKILVEHDKDFVRVSRLRRFLEPLLGSGLLTSEGDLHKRQRKLIMPVLKQQCVVSYTEMMVDYANKRQLVWASGDTVDIAQEMMQLTLNIAAVVLLGADLSHEADQISQAFTIALRYANDNINTLLNIPLSWPTSANRRLRHAVTRLDGTIQGIIEQRRHSTTARDDLLSRLLEAQDEFGCGMSDQQIRDEAVTLLMSGHETTASALAWTWYLLMQHPESYTRLQEEVDRVLGGRLPTLADLAQLPYTLQVLKESMRLYPPVYVLGRESVCSVNLGDYEIPAATPMAISPYILHRRADVFENPERFDPDRFTPEREQRIPRYAYIPFGAGSRSCIGYHFALTEAQLILALLAQSVSFRLIANQHIAAETMIALRPHGGIRAVVQRR